MESHQDPMLPVPYQVVARHRETADIVTLEMCPKDGSPPLSFQPGQFTMLYVFGVGEVPISISGDPRNRGVLVHTIRDVGAVSHALASLDVGDTVGVRGPYGSTWPVHEARGGDVLVIAGGLGLAPVRPIVYELLHDRQAYGHFGLLFGTRSPADFAFRSELEQWRSHLDLDLYVTVDRADRSWRGHVGVVTILLPKVTFEPNETTAFLCGPEIMMRITAGKLDAMGIPPENIHVSLERNMQCAVGFCGHCQYGSDFLCKDGPVLPFESVRKRLAVKEL